MITLPCMKKLGDGSHWGLTDWYEPLERGIKAALRKGPKHTWTTGWYGSKKEIASCRISNIGNGLLTVEVSVSDDFDTVGLGDSCFPFTKDLEFIRKRIDSAWDRANANQKGNHCYRGFKVLAKRRVYGIYIGGKPQGRAVMRDRWIATYIQPAGEGYSMDTPPGDNYYRWGWQETGGMPSNVKRAFTRWIESGKWHKDRKKVMHGYTCMPWEEDE
jgi:hypothetical protein